MFRRKTIDMSSEKHYKKYRKSTTNPVDFTTWKNVVKGFSEKIVGEIKVNRNGVSLPYRLGILMVIAVEASKKPWRIARNIKLSVDLGHTVEEPNLGTGGLQCKILYSTYEERYTRPERKIWRFKGCRKFTRGVSKVFRENWEYFMYLSPKTTINDAYRDYMKQAAMERVPLDVYNPLEA